MTRRLVLGLALLATGFAAGAWAARRGLLPSGLLRWTTLGGPVEEAGARSKKPLAPDAMAGAAEAMPRSDEMDALGYARGFKEADGEHGVITWSRSRAQPGFNVCLSGHVPGAALLGMDGQVLHEWRLSLEEMCPGEYDLKAGSAQFWRRALLLEDGSLLVVVDYRALARVDRDSNLIWKRCEQYHHDVDVDDRGRVYALSRQKRPLRPPFQSETALDDEIHVLTLDGDVVDRFSVLDLLADSEYAPLAMRIADQRPLKRTGDIFHTNSVRAIDAGAGDLPAPFRAGQVVLSIRHLDTIAVVDLEQRRAIWAWSGPWRAQHDATMLDDGHILFFDNQGLAFADPQRPSRVVEIDPLAHRIAWSYDGAPDRRFGSLRCGAVQRLPNGNTLITITADGRAIEVAPDGEVVWEYRNAHRAGEHGELVAGLFEIVRVPASRCEWLATH